MYSAAWLALSALGEEEKDVVLRAKLYYLLGYPTSAMNILRVNVGMGE